MKSTLWRRVSFTAFSGLLVCSSVGAADPTANSLTAVSSHPAGRSKAELAAKGGLSTYVMVNGKVILFDTGYADSPLAQNLEELGLDASLIEAVVFSRNHLDHVDGLSDVLSATTKNPKIYVPAPAGEALSRQFPDAVVVPVSEPTGVFPDAWLVGPIHLDESGEAVAEQALVLDQPDGLVVIVGCSHPGIVSVVEQVKEFFGQRRIKLVAGGPHLLGTSKKEIREVSLRLQQMGVKDLALSNCTGEPALKIFRQEWGDRVVSLDRGDAILFDR